MNKMIGMLCVGWVGTLLGTAFGGEEVQDPDTPDAEVTVELDKYDPKDDTKEGKPTSLSVSSKPKLIERTLCKTDPADWFKINLKPGVYYHFGFAERTGDAIIMQEGDPDIVSIDDFTGVIRAKQATPWYLRVTHITSEEEEWEDSTYTLSVSSITPKTISVSSKPKETKGTLTKKDPVNYFKVNVKPGMYYSFELTDDTEDADLSLDSDKDSIVLDELSGLRRATEADTWYLRAACESDPEDFRDSNYSLTCSSITPKTVSVSSKPKETKGTLTRDNSVNYFKVNVKQGVYYHFSLSEETGDAVLSVENEDGSVAMDEVTGLVRAKQTGVWNLKVFRGPDTAESSECPYTLSSYSVTPKTLSVSSKLKETNGTLAQKDSAEIFKLKVKEGVYYRFEIPKSSGDPKLSWDSDNDSIIEDEASGFFRAKQDDTWYLQVAHAGEQWQDCDYALSAVSKDLGTISFAKSEIKVKENAPYVDLSVKRSSKEGACEIGFKTKSFTAYPTEEFYPMSGTLKWADGDNKPKNIRVRLLPDLEPMYEGEDKKFYVALQILSDDFLIPAIKGPDTATIILQEVDKPQPGTVAAYSYKWRASDNDKFSNNDTFEDLKKPEMLMSYGQTNRIWFIRYGGSDGAISISVTTAKGKALPGTHYKELDETIHWEDGDDSPKSVLVETLGEGYRPRASFTIKMKDVTKKGTPRPKLLNSSVIVNVKDFYELWDLAELSKMSKERGYTVKESKKGSWYPKHGGTPRYSELISTVPLTEKLSKTDLTFTLDGSGVLSMVPVLGKGLTVTAKLGKEETRTLGADVEDFFVQEGKQTLKISVVRNPDLSQSDAPEFQFSYFWCKVDQIEAKAPLVDKVLVSPGMTEFNFTHVFSYLEKEIEGASCEYKVYCAEASKKKELRTEASLVETVEEDQYMKELEPGKKYLWQVEATLYQEDAEGKKVPRITVLNKKPWSFSVMGTEEGLRTMISGTDVYGDEIVVDDANRTTTDTDWLYQGVKVDMSLYATNSQSDQLTYSVVGGKLPPGLKLEKNGTLTGVPTTSGNYDVLYQVKDGTTRTQGATLFQHFYVSSIDMAKGIYQGIAKALKENDDVTEGLYDAALVSFTASEQGRLTASVNLGGKKYSFKADCFDSITSSEDPNEEYFNAEMTSIQKFGKVSYTNRLEICLINEMDMWNWTPPTHNLYLRMAVPGPEEDPVILEYEGNVYQDNTKKKEFDYDEPELDEYVDPFVGYYTMAIISGENADPDSDDPPPAPSCHGYLTFTIDAKGKVKYSGALDDGTKFSGSSCISPRYHKKSWKQVIDDVRWPLFFVKKDTLFAGEIVLKARDSVTAKLTWSNDDPKSTYEGKEGFKLELLACGAIYDDLVNLQTYYLNSDLFVRYEKLEDLGQICPDGYAFIPTLGVDGFDDIELVGNQIEVPKRKLVKEKGAGYDWKQSINPQDLSIKVNRATGIVTGGCSLWIQDEKSGQQKEIKVKHQGVINDWRCLYYYDSFKEHLVFPFSMGFFSVPIKIKEGKKIRTWKAAYPFNVTVEGGWA